MRQPRIKGQGQSFYHCVSRVVDARFLFQTQSPGSIEAEHFVHLMRRLEKACRVQVLTYALMANHFHILCKVPQRETEAHRQKSGAYFRVLDPSSPKLKPSNKSIT